MTKTIDLDTLYLKTGSHKAPANGLADACVMEAVAYLAGERWSDHPECASPVLGAFLRSWNDVLADDDRQDLKRYIPRLVGSRGTPEQEDARAWLAMDWLVRDYAPGWLRLAKLEAQAALLEGLPEFKAGMDVPSVRPTINAVRDDARAAGDAARDAAGDAAWASSFDGDPAWAAAWAAARAAARDAAGAAAWDARAAGDAARDAAGAAAWDPRAAGDAARDAAGAAAWDARAAGDAARDAAGAAAWDARAAGDAARDAAWAAAWDALRPTTIALQESAHRLVDRMLAVTGS